MKAIRRLTTSIVTSFESMISQVENHEALVESAIREVKETAARAQGQIVRVRKDGAAMKNRITELQQQITLWGDRAAKAATLDRQKAIECLRRRKRLEQEHADLSKQVVEHAKLERQLADDLGVIEEKLSRLKVQRNLLRTRQTRAEALGTLHQDDSRIISELDDVFDRWESKVSEYEYLANCGGTQKDEIEEQFTREESNEELSHELDELLKTQEQPHS